MSIQRKIDLLDATPINDKTVLARLDVYGHAGSETRGSEPSQPFAEVTLSILRFIVAAYANGEADSWEAAFRVAEETLGIEGPQLVAHVVALVRSIRRHRDILCWPPACRGLSLDEQRVMMLIGAGSDDNPSNLGSASEALDFVQLDQALTTTVKALAEFGERRRCRLRSVA